MRGAQRVSPAALQQPNEMWLLTLKCARYLLLYTVNQVKYGPTNPELGEGKKEGCMDYFNPVELDRRSLNSSRLGRRFARPPVDRLW